jgi:hypothetical protein
MPRDGAMILADVRGPTLTIVCERCGRYGRYTVKRLIAMHGEAKLTDLLVTLANCKKARSFGIHDRAKRSSRALASELNPSSTVTAPKSPRQRSPPSRLEAMAAERAHKPWWQRLFGRAE